MPFQSTPATVRDYGYYDDGAISSQSDGTTAYGYNYTAGTHQLDRVSPNLPGRNTSGAGNFQYDDNGRITGDQGSGKSFSYNTADMPTQLTVSGVTHSLFYDENNYRVADLEEGASGQILARKVYVYESGLKVVKEIIKRETGHPDGALELTKVNEYGQSGIVAVGYSGQTDRHVLLKDHQGSVIGAVSVNSLGVIKEQGYLPYGGLQNRVVPSTEEAPSLAFTGKEFEPHVNLYYFGARFYDPELGLWISPDAVNTYFNPYVFGGGAVGGDPLNFVDPDGNCPICPMIFFVLAVAAGTYTGAKIAESQGYDMSDPEYWLYVTGGAAVGGLSVGAGLAVAGSGMAFAGTAGLVTGSTLASAGFYALSGGKSDFQTNLGFGTICYTCTDKFDINNPFDDEPLLKNIGDAAGWATNVVDIAEVIRNNLPDRPKIDESTPEGQLVKENARGPNEKFKYELLDRQSDNPIVELVNKSRGDLDIAREEYWKGQPWYRRYNPFVRYNSRTGNHWQNFRLQGGGHLAIDVPGGPIIYHYDYFDATAFGGFESFPHLYYEVYPTVTSSFPYYSSGLTQAVGTQY